MNAKNLPLLLLFISFNLFSQVGIGTANPNPSAALDIVSSNSGLLIPRIALSSTTDVSTIPSPATSLLVYNTATVSNVTPGFYFFEGTWKPMAGSGVPNSGWSLTGNNILTSNFIGTTNNEDLNFKVNNNDAGKLSANQLSTSFGLGSNSSFMSTSFGNGATATANESVAVGYLSRTDFRGIALGKQATNLGTESIAIGFQTNSQFQSIAIGSDARATNNESVALGQNSSATAFRSIAIGKNAIASSNNTIALGIGVVANQANSIVLGSGLDVGINTNAPTKRLDVNGEVRVRNLPNGATNDRLVSVNTNGDLRNLTLGNNFEISGSTLNTKVVVAEIYNNASQLINSTIYTNINLAATSISNGGTVVAANSVSVPENGIYEITYRVSFDPADARVTGVFQITRNNISIVGSESYAYSRLPAVNTPYYTTANATKIISLNANDVIRLQGRSLRNAELFDTIVNGCNLIVKKL